MAKSIQGKAESRVWRHNATLKDLLDLLDSIETDPGKSLEEKAKLRQRVIDYGQHISEAIHNGKINVPESDDNETIKKFNIRMQSTYNTKGESSYEEAKRQLGYYDEHGEFIKDPYDTPRDGTIRHTNPRWHPIPLKEEPVVIPEPITRNDETVVPVPPTGRDNIEIVPHVTPTTEDNIAVVPPATLTQGADITESVIPTGTNTQVTEQTSNEQPKKDKERKRRIPAWLKAAPLFALGGLLTLKDAKPVQTQENDKLKDKTEVVSQTPVMTCEESEYMRYTIEKGQRMMAKQHDVSIEEGARLYNEFVENIREGNIPEEMQIMAKEYNMSKMVDNDLNLDLDNPEIAATTWLLMSESYPSISPIVQNAVENPQEHISSIENVRIKKYLGMANAAAKSHKANPESNLVSTVDYGLYGASKNTGWAIVFRQEKGGKTDKVDKGAYHGIAKSALHEGRNY